MSCGIISSSLIDEKLVSKRCQWVQGRRRVQKNFFEEIMAKTFSNLRKIINLQIQEAQ